MTPTHALSAEELVELEHAFSDEPYPDRKEIDLEYAVFIDIRDARALIAAARQAEALADMLEDILPTLQDAIPGISIEPIGWDEWTGNSTLSEDQMNALDEAKTFVSGAISSIYAALASYRGGSDE